MILSYDCFLKEIWLNFFAQSDYIFKIFITCFVPFIFILISFCFFLPLKALCRKRINLFRVLIVSMITILWQFYPNQSKMIISIFNCKSIDNVIRLSKDLNIVCWKDNHLKWAIGWGMPMLLLWVFGLPIISFVFLLLKRKKL